MAENKQFGISEQLDDMISRAAVVDAIEGVDWYHINKNGEMVHGANDAEHQAWYKADDIYAAIERVPSAQPVAKDINVPCKDCISRQAAIDALDNIKIARNASWYPYYQQALTAMSKLPSAQRTGRWIYGKVKHIKNGELRNVRECSECGSSYFVYDYYNSVEEIPKFCPNCGAKMKGEWE